MKVDVLGVKIDDISMDQALEIVMGWLKRRDKHYIVTPNPEFLVAAQKDTEFKNILNKADLAIPDGAGLKLSGKVKNTVYGTDLMDRLIEQAVEKGFVIGLLGGQKGVAEKLKECLERQYQNISIVFASDGGKVNLEGKGIDEKERKIPKLDILFVAFGQIKQEKWISGNLKKIPVKVAMGVGGAFNYLSGNTPRAPKFIRDSGFEWLFRLMIEPWRIKRQFALLKYLYLIMVH